MDGCWRKVREQGGAACIVVYDLDAKVPHWAFRRDQHVQAPAAHQAAHFRSGYSTGAVDPEGPISIKAVGEPGNTEGAAAVVQLAQQYGTFVLSNAIPLAEALEVEDGTAGI